MAKKRNIKASSKKKKKEINDREERGEVKIKKNQKKMQKKKLDKRRSRPRVNVISKESTPNIYRNQKNKKKENNGNKVISKNKIGKPKGKLEIIEKKKQLSFSKKKRLNENRPKILSTTKKKLRSYVEEENFIENEINIRMIMEKKKRKGKNSPVLRLSRNSK